MWELGTVQDVAPKRDGMREKYPNVSPRPQSLAGASNWLNPPEGSQQGSLGVRPAAVSLPGQVGRRQTDPTEKRALVISRGASPSSGGQEACSRWGLRAPR